MTKEFNSCASLINPEIAEAAHNAYDKILAEGKNPLDYMIELQTAMQTRLAKEKPAANVDPTKLETMGEIHDWTRNQDLYLQDEAMEQLTALGGMSNGSDASAIWKTWKSSHGEARERKYDELSEADRLEILFEISDQWHFFLNKHIPFKLNARDIFMLYFIKNAENHDRQDRGY